MEAFHESQNQAHDFLLPRQAANPTTLAPPGVIPNYANPHTISHRVVASSLTLVVFASIFVTIRLGIKWRVVKKWGWDDGFGHSSSNSLYDKYGNPKSHPDSVLISPDAQKYFLGYHTWDINPKDLIAKGEMQKNLLFIGDMLYLVSIMCTKLSILIFYIQIFGIKKPFRYLCFLMMAVVISYCIIFFFIEAFNCNPVQKVWHTLTYKGNFTCFDNSMVEFVIGGFNIGTDLIILVMPMPMVLDLKMELRRRLGLLVIFSTGIFVFASTIVREVVVVQTLRDFDQSWVTVPETVWLTVENDIGIMCACLPAFAPLRKTRLFDEIIPSSVQYLLRNSGYGSAKGSSNNSPSKASSKRMGYHKTESGIELVDGAKGDGTIRSTTDVEVIYSKKTDASDQV